MRRAPLVALAGLCACPPPSSDTSLLTTAKPVPEDSSSGAASEGGSATATTTSDSSGEPTTDAAPPTTIGATTGEGFITAAPTSTGVEPDVTTGTPNAPPEILSLSAEPGVVEQAGSVVLTIEASDDVTQALIEFGDDLAVMIDITQPVTPYEVEVTSLQQCLESQFKVTVFDIRGLSDEDTLALDCQMPTSGAEMYTSHLDGSSATDVALLPDGGALVSGVKDGRMAVWALDAAGQVKPGWPKTIDKWSLDPKFDGLPSWASTVARDSQGRIYVGGTIKEADGLRRYVAKLNAQGFLIWEDPGPKLGEEIEGIAVTSDDVAVAVGSIRTNALDKIPAFYDMGVWGYPSTFPQAQAWSSVFKQPATDPMVDQWHTFIERGRDAVALPGGEVIVVGEREYWLDNETWFMRAFWQRYASAGAPIGAPWTSDGFKFKHDAARSGTRTKEGFALVGWGEYDENDSERQVLVQRFDLAGKILGVQHESSPKSAQGEGISQDREQKLVVAATSGNFAWSAWIFATIGADQPHVWEQSEDKMVAAAIECDDWGACTWVGTADIDGKSTAIASKRAP